ncbi:hypothetical protein [Roseateles sp.]|uniref:hypothetical protein n=1 Tax=Roseateles sp. TaxID=1971397 RepID=UPI003BAB0448
MLNKALILFCLFIFLFSETGFASAEKVVTLKRLHDVNGELLKIAERQKLPDQRDHARDYSEIKQILASINEVELLERLAISSRNNRFPGRAEDSQVDDVMDEAWRLCISEIEQRGGQAAIESLERIQRREHLDGADSLLVRQGLKKLKSKKHTR